MQKKILSEIVVNVLMSFVRMMDYIRYFKLISILIRLKHPICLQQLI